LLGRMKFAIRMPPIYEEQPKLRWPHEAILE
jgi:hypothetical protein